MAKDPKRLDTGDAQPPTPAFEQSFVVLRTEIDRVLENFVREFAPPLRWRGAGHSAFGRVELEIGGGDAIRPPADLTERPDGFELTVELPGLVRDDVEVAMTDDSIVVSGVKDEGEIDETTRLHLRERRYGTFRRVFGIPPEVDRDRVAASFDNGLLTIVLPRGDDAGAAARQVPVVPR